MKKLKQIIEFLKTHNKNLTKEQDFKISDAEEELEKLSKNIETVYMLASRIRDFESNDFLSEQLEDLIEKIENL